MGGVQVLIGGEGTWEELRDCSVVLARYGAPGLASAQWAFLVQSECLTAGQSQQCVLLPAY